MTFTELRDHCRKEQWWALPIDFAFEFPEDSRPPDFGSIVDYLNHQGWAMDSNRNDYIRTIHVRFRHRNPYELTRQILARNGLEGEVRIRDYRPSDAATAAATDRAAVMADAVRVVAATYRDAIMAAARVTEKTTPPPSPKASPAPLPLRSHYRHLSLP